MKTNKGFTLIELLVVIAIIGILSSVVLASLNSARSRGADAAVKSNLANLRAQAEIGFDTMNGNYGPGQTGNSCPTTGNTIFATTASYTLKGGIDAAKAAGGGAVTCSTDVTSGLAKGWAVTATLKDNTKAWCVDSSGASKEILTTGVPAAGDATCD